MGIIGILRGGEDEIERRGLGEEGGVEREPNLLPTCAYGLMILADEALEDEAEVRV